MKIGYRDYIQDALLGDSGDLFLDAGAPLDNLKDRQLASVARSTHQWVNSSSDSFAFQVDLVESKSDIQILALLGHNFPGTIQLGVTFYDASESVITFIDVPVIWVPPVDSQFPRNTIVILDTPPANVRYMAVGALVSPGVTLDEAIYPQAGRFWAGPVWSPTAVPGTGRRAFRIQTRDDSVLDKSDGQQAYADIKPRFRQLTCTLPWLTEAEAIGTEDGETQNLQDIAFEVGKALPIIVIPDERNNQLIHKFGIYGTFADPPSVDLIEDSAGTEETGLAYSTQFDVIEEL